MKSMRRGFALLTVLWIMISISVLASGIDLDAQRAFATLDKERTRAGARWIAEGCIARLRSVTDAALHENPARAVLIWRTFDQLAASHQGTTLTNCYVTTSIHGRVMLEHASEEELLQLPGMTPEAMAHVWAMRSSNIPITDFVLLHARLTGVAKTIFEHQYQQFMQRVTTDPDAWTVRVQARIESPLGAPATPLNIEARLVRAGTRTAIIRWIEW